VRFRPTAYNQPTSTSPSADAYGPVQHTAFISHPTLIFQLFTHCNVTKTRVAAVTNCCPFNANLDFKAASDGRTGKTRTCILQLSRIDRVGLPATRRNCLYNYPASDRIMSFPTCMRRNCDPSDCMQFASVTNDCRLDLPLSLSAPSKSDDSRCFVFGFTRFDAGISDI